jgi:rsbT co-antagonist protein RsbR
VTNSTGSPAALLADKNAILAHWVGITGQRLRGRATQAELEREQSALLDAIHNGFTAGSTDADSENFAAARALLEELSYSRARRGFSPTETCSAVFALKEAVLAAVQKSGDQVGGEAFQEFGRLIDHLGLFTFEVFTAARERIITAQSEQLLELSTPVVSLWEGVVAVPLVGTLDSARTQVIMEKLLQALVDTGSDQAIIDITGVPAVDTQVAQHLLKTVVAARLMGAECIISGIRPQIAQTIVALGIEFGDIRTKSSLADALMLAIRNRESGRRRASVAT